MLYLSAKTKVIRTSRQPSQLQKMIDLKQLENVEYLKYFVSLITNHARCTCGVKSRIATAKEAFSNTKKILFNSKLGLELRDKPVKCYIWSTALYGAESWTLSKVDQKYQKSFEMWCWKRMEKISWTDRVKNEEVLHRVKQERNVPCTIKEGRLTGLVMYCVGSASKIRL